MFEGDSERIDKSRFENVIKDVSLLSIVVAGGAFLQLSSPVASRSERSRDLERASEILLERSLHAGQRMAQVHEEGAAKRLSPASDEETSFPSAIALPGHENLALGRHWHFLADLAWLLTGLTYILMLFVVGVLLWLVNNFIPMQGTIKSILNAVVVIGVVLWLLNVYWIISFVPQNSHRVGGKPPPMTKAAPAHRSNIVRCPLLSSLTIPSATAA